MAGFRMADRLGNPRFRSPARSGSSQPHLLRPVADCFGEMLERVGFVTFFLTPQSTRLLVEIESMKVKGCCKKDDGAVAFQWGGAGRSRRKSCVTDCGHHWRADAAVANGRQNTPLNPEQQNKSAVAIAIFIVYTHTNRFCCQTLRISSAQCPCGIALPFLFK